MFRSFWNDYLSFRYENQLLRESEAGDGRGDDIIYDLQLSNLLFGDSNTPPARNSSEGEGSELEQQEGESNASLKIRIEMKREQRLLRKASFSTQPPRNCSRALHPADAYADGPSDDTSSWKI